MSASGAEGFDRGQEIGPVPYKRWSEDDEAAWQQARAEEARKESYEEKQFITASYPHLAASNNDIRAKEGAAARQFSPSPSRTQHRFIREDVREEERNKLFARRYGEP